MDSWMIPIKLLLALVLGAAIGLERELNEKKTNNTYHKKPEVVLGLRSFSLVTLIGAVTGFLYEDYMGLSLLIGGVTTLFFIVFYVIDTLQTKVTGITTELALIVSFILGVLLAIELFPTQVILALAVVFILILSRKRKIKDVVGEIHHDELNAFIGYALIAVVILPFLPNTTYALSDITGLKEFIRSMNIPFERVTDIELFNPFKLWLIVALITGIDIVGYILERTIGQKKGWILASIAGGFVSSTATTQSLAQQSKESKRVNHLLAAALVANLVSFIQIAILLSPINTTFVVQLLPTFLSIIVVALLVTVYCLKIKEKNGDIKKSEKKVSEDGIFEIGPALKFAGIFILISIISKIALEFYGNGAFLVTTAIGALAGLDAVMINTAQLAGNRIDFGLAYWAFFIANTVNLLGKVGYSFLQGKKEFAIKFAISVAAIIGASLVGIVFV